MVANIKAILRMVKGMEEAYTQQRIHINIQVSLKMALERDSVTKYSKMETSIKGHSRMESTMGEAGTHMLMDAIILDNGNMELKKDKVKKLIIMVKYIKDNLRMEDTKGKEFGHGPVEIHSMEHFKMKGHTAWENISLKAKNLNYHYMKMVSS